LLLLNQNPLHRVGDGGQVGEHDLGLLGHDIGFIHQDLGLGIDIHEPRLEFGLEKPRLPNGLFFPSFGSPFLPRQVKRLVSRLWLG
jgi:hypothetical protein